MGPTTTLGVVLCMFLHLKYVLATNKREGDRSHWCCDVEIESTFTNFTKIQYIKENVTEIKNITTNHTRHCNEGEIPDGYGLLHIPYCRLIQQIKVIVEKLRPVNVTVSIPQNGVCPPEHTICCEGFVKVSDQCIESGTANSPEIQKLIDAGLLVG